ncbi:MAG: polysaccharide deacetylase family protein [Planctomycetota bacterium]
MKRGVFITFDVECSMGGAFGDPGLRPVPPSRAIWGEYNGRKLGLPLIVEILQQHGLAGTFFVEAFTDEQGYPGEIERACEYLLNHGQDVQLHVHPNRMRYALERQGKSYPRTDYIADLSPDGQLTLLEKGRDRIARWTGRPAIAFRAGNMGASEETLEHLEAAEIPIDSSYTFSFAGGQCRFSPEEPYNGSKWYGGVLELALSGFYQLRLPGMHPAKPVDLMSISFEECRDAIRRITGAGADAVMILHSFSLFKWRNKQYEGGKLNRIVTGRFRRFCRWLAASESPPAYTFAQLHEAIVNKTYEANHVPPCRLSHPRAVVRKAMQAWNNLYWT